jgi:PKD repeat protein
MSTLLRGVAASVVLAVSLVAIPSGASAEARLPGSDPVDHTPRVLDKQARSIAEVGDRVVIGGNFTEVQDATTGVTVDQPYVFAFDPSTGGVDEDFLPRLNGDVTTVLAHPSGDNVWVAGSFTQVNGDYRSRVVLLDLDTGEPVGSFAAPSISAEVTSMQLANGYLYIGGDFVNVAGRTQTALAALDANTGALTDHVRSTITGTLMVGQGTTTIKDFDISSDGRRLVAIGNFSQVDGAPRVQLAMWDTSGDVATLRRWATEKFGATCNPVFPSYMRDVDLAPDGSFFVAVTTGAYRSGQLCDTASRWEVGGRGLDRSPTWISYTGGDTLTAVEVTGPTAYLGGHMRWLNNPFKGDAAGAGAWPTEGIAAVDTRNGLPLSWNPGRSRGLGVFDFLPSDSTLWAVSDTNTWANEYRPRLAGFPMDDGLSLPPDEIGRLPGDVWQLGNVAGAAADDQRGIGFDGTAVQMTVDDTGDAAWGNVRGAFAVDETVYAGWRDGTFTAQSWDGTTFGSPAPVELYAGTSSTPGYANNFVNDLPSVTGMFFDPVRARIYYTMRGSTELYWRAFTPESQVVGAARRTLVKSKALSPAKVRGMFLAGNQVFFADATTGNLKRVTLAHNSIAGPAAVVNSAIDWRANALVLSSQWAQLATNVSPVAALSVSCTGRDCLVEATRSTDADGGIVDVSVDYGDGATGTGAQSAHTYDADGAYAVTVTVTDNRGLMSTKTRTVTVVGLPNESPTPRITTSCWALQCTFDGASSSDSDGVVVDYSWSVDGVAVGGGSQRAHTFASGGSHEVTLSVTDDAGATSASTKTVTVNAIATSIDFRAGVSDSQDLGSLPAVDVPDEVVAGDLMLLFISNGSDRLADIPSGWTSLSEARDGSLRTQVFWRFATSTDPGRTVSARLRNPLNGEVASGPNTTTLAAYSGVESPPIVTHGSAVETNETIAGVSAHTAPDVVVPRDGHWVLSYWADRTSGLTSAWTAPGAQRERATGVSAGTSLRVSSLLSDDGAPSSAGARAGLTATANGATRTATMWTIVLRSQ